MVWKDLASIGGETEFGLPLRHRISSTCCGFRQPDESVPSSSDVSVLEPVERVLEAAVGGARATCTRWRLVSAAVVILSNADKGAAAVTSNPKICFVGLELGRGDMRPFLGEDLCVCVLKKNGGEHVYTYDLYNI